MATTDTVDTTNLPPFLGVNVARVDPATGKPTKPTLDNELAERDWFLTTTINMNTRLTEVRSDTDTNSAAITTEAITRATADSALASLVTTVEVRSTGGAVITGSATAQMSMIAESNPSGFVSTFGLYLRNSGVNYPVGLTGYLDSGGTGIISFTATKFFWTDPSYNSGLPGNVAAYSGGVWQFNVPVLLRTGELAANAATKVRSNSSSGATSVSIVATDWNVGSEVTVLALASSTQGYSNSAVTAIPTTSYLQIYLDGALQNQAFVPITLDTRCSGGSGTVNLTTGAITSFTPTNQVWWQCPAAPCYAKFNTSSTSHTITAQWHSSSTGMPNADWFLVAIETKR
jgi:hypothetical protein